MVERNGFKLVVPIPEAKGEDVHYYRNGIDD